MLKVQQNCVLYCFLSIICSNIINMMISELDTVPRLKTFLLHITLNVLSFQLHGQHSLNLCHINVRSTQHFPVSYRCLTLCMYICWKNQKQLKIMLSNAPYILKDCHKVGSQCSQCDKTEYLCIARFSPYKHWIKTNKSRLVQHFQLNDEQTQLGAAPTSIAE